MYRTPPTIVSKGALLALLALSVRCAAEVDSYCSSVGPPCGLTVDFDGGNLEVGTYAIEIETPAGLTTCAYEVRAPSRQSAEEAEKSDEALLECGENDTCEEPCAGPETVYPRAGSLTVAGDAQTLTITVENVESGARSEASFSPSYDDHPEECADCVVAADSMPLPTP